MNTKPAQISLFLAVFLLLPFVGSAAQKMITEQSVNSAYQAKIAFFDARTKLLQAQIVGKCDEVTIQHVQLKPIKQLPKIDCVGVTQEISQIKQDRHIIDVAHQFILDSLK